MYKNSLTGNSTTATRLQTARSIAGNLNGTENIDIPITGLSEATFTLGLNTGQILKVNVQVL